MTGALVDPVAARIAPDLVLPRSVAPDDLALLDQNPALRESPPAGACWVISEANGLRIRYVRREGTRLFIANESSVADPARWRSLSLSDRGILDIVRARVVWVGRDLRPDGSSSG
ncbi:MAG: hypothetical protein M3N54_13445 [Acidobacteriota bacterium]|nr:hypothetical protein [Acidobacteriota bacterium]